MTVSLAKPLGLEFVENAAAWQKKNEKKHGFVYKERVHTELI